MQEIDLAGEARSVSRWAVIVFALMGLLLIAVSLLIPDEGRLSLIREFLRELGVVVFAVFAVSFIYEVIVAEKYFRHFSRMLGQQIQRGESNAAVCAHLGIREIYTTRPPYESAYPVSGLVDNLGPGSRFRVISKTMFLMITKTEAFQTALLQSTSLEFCILDPETAPDELAKSPDIEVTDLYSTLAIFKKRIVDWIDSEKPPGTLELRFHHSAQIDSYLFVRSVDYGLSAWDLSFGRELTAKRVLVVDPLRPFGIDLYHRYDHIWNRAQPVFRYDGNAIVLDKLPESPIRVDGR